MKSVLVIGAAVLSLALATPAGADDFRKGRSAFDAGDHRAALAQWLPLAKRGHADAQAAVAWLYLNGLGVARDEREAARWYERAARQQQPEAVYFLGTLYLAGRGVGRDDYRAYVLCGLALARGNQHGLGCRDDAALGLSAGDRERAERALAREIGHDRSDP